MRRFPSWTQTADLARRGFGARNRRSSFSTRRPSRSTAAPSSPRKRWRSSMARRSTFRFGSTAAACWPGAGQFGTPEQGIFAYWMNAHLRRRPLRYIGFGGTRQAGSRCLSSARSGGADRLFKCDPGTGGGQRIYTAGGGPANAMSLAQLTAWCDERFGAHPPSTGRHASGLTISLGWSWTTAMRASISAGSPRSRSPTFWTRSPLMREAHPDWLELSGV